MSSLVKGYLPVAPESIGDTVGCRAGGGAVLREKAGRYEERAVGVA